MGLFGSSILEFSLSVIFIYLLVASLASAVMEWISARLAWRAKDLKSGIENLFTPPQELLDAFTQHGPGEKQIEVARKIGLAVYQHPLIQAPHNQKLLSYVPSRTFALALVDELTKDHATAPGSYDALQEYIRQPSTPESVRRALMPLIQSTDGNLSPTQKLDRAREAIAQWFDESMEYLSAGYKRRMHAWLFGIGLVLAVGLHIDSLYLFDRLWSDSAMRGVIAGAATKTSGEKLPSDNEIKEATKGIKLPFGWQGDGRELRAEDGKKIDVNDTKSLFDLLGKLTPFEVLAAVMGWIITAGAAALGAPFWFDLLNRVVNLRTGTKPVAAASSPPGGPPPPPPPPSGSPNAPIDQAALNAAVGNDPLAAMSAATLLELQKRGMIAADPRQNLARAAAQDPNQDQEQQNVAG